jgi:hypothetical protein
MARRWGDLTQLQERNYAGCHVYRVHPTEQR